ncbi:MFS transporter [Hominibacterium faecale]|uniref:MFS transporter n=1 Tax=Hominibacterium faecale TaxID=2839743 RepID=UPI0022B297D5|nr:MFS transporter [Hominibacterium faecale]
MKRLLNFEYACIHGTYWMFYGVASSFASVFLLARGYSSSQIGVTLAAANILAVVLQPMVADLADRIKRLSLIGITEILTIMMMAVTVGLFIFDGRTAALCTTFVLLIAWHTVLHPLLNSLTFKLEECGVAINFGVARSMGSLAYSALVAVLGTLVEERGILVLPITGEIILAMLLISLIFTKKSYDQARQINEKKVPAAAEKPNGKDEESINLWQFIKNNKPFFLVNLGVIGLYFSNSILNNYMMQIVASVGGSSQDMGWILSLMAFLEIPTMICFNFLRKKFSCQLLIKTAAVGFTAKIGICYLAGSVAMIFVAQVFQLVSFALFLPAMVHFIDEVMRKGEAVKGQALFTTMITITTVFSSLIGGMIIDASGAKMLTMVSTLATAAGAVIIIAAVDRVKPKTE